MPWNPNFIRNLCSDDFCGSMNSTHRTHRQNAEHRIGQNTQAKRTLNIIRYFKILTVWTAFLKRVWKFVHYCTPLVWWSLHKYKYLWGMEGKGRNSSLKKKKNYKYCSNWILFITFHKFNFYAQFKTTKI